MAKLVHDDPATWSEWKDFPFKDQLANARVSRMVRPDGVTVLDISVQVGVTIALTDEDLYLIENQPEDFKRRTLDPMIRNLRAAPCYDYRESVDG